jgi:hydrogenase maturation factor HypE
MPNTFINKGAALTTGGADIYGPVAASTQAIIHSCIISNIHATDSADVGIKATVQNGATYYHIAKNVPIPAGSSLVIDKPIDLMTGDEIHMTASANSTLETVLGILEIT